MNTKRHEGLSAVNVCCLSRIRIIIGQGPTVLAVGAGWDCLNIYSLVYLFSVFFLLPIRETVQYRL